VSRHIKHVISEIVAPWGPGIDERPPVMSAEERATKYWAHKNAKDERRRRRREGEVESGEEIVDGMVEGTQVAS